MNNKAIILLGGPGKGTRFRPLSLYIPKPLFPIGGIPLIYHTIESLSKVPNLTEIILLGCYPDVEKLNEFIQTCRLHFKISIRYLKENEIMGSAGGIYRYKKEIMSGNVNKFFVINGDVTGDLPFSEMLTYHQSHCKENQFIILGKHNDPSESSNYGCISYDERTSEVLHFVEKPSEFSSNTISCGVYLFGSAIFNNMEAAILNAKQLGLEENFKNGYAPSADAGDVALTPTNGRNGNEKAAGKLSFEHDIFPNLAGRGLLFVLVTSKPWMHLKSASSAIYADSLRLMLYHTEHPEFLAKNSPTGPTIKGDVYISPKAVVDPSAVIGPSVSICDGVRVGMGVRIRDSIICDNVVINNHAFVTNSIVGWNSSVGKWTRIEGEPCEEYSKESHLPKQPPLFTAAGKLNPSVTIIANDVEILSEVVVFNAIVLPHKELKECTQNQIVL